MKISKRALTARERAVLQGIWDGKSVKEVAADLNLERCTIKNRLSSVYLKLGVSGQVLAIRRGLELGLLTVRVEPHDNDTGY